METAFYLASVVAIIATILTITRMNAVHGLLYLIVSLLSIAIVFYTMGAPFIAALEVITYAGAIMVLFVFVVMMLNLGERAVAIERQWWTPGMWIGPGILAALLFVEIVYLLFTTVSTPALSGASDPKQVGLLLFGPYLIGIELASMLLLAGLVGAYHVGWRQFRAEEVIDDTHTHAGRAISSGNLVHPGTDWIDRATQSHFHSDVD